MPPAYKKNLSQKPKPQIKTFQPPAEKSAHWFQVSVVYGTDALQFREPLEGGLNKRTVGVCYGYDYRIFALSARDAHYQLSVQMEALGWTEGQNWRVTMICPEAEK